MTTLIYPVSEPVSSEMDSSPVGILYLNTG